MRYFVFLAGVAMLARAEELPELNQSERLKWATYSTLGPPNMVGGLFKAGLQTWVNDPEEYGPHWKGYGQRYALRLPGIAISNLMEAELGAMWGEDPRYHRKGGRAVGNRAWNAVKFAFVAQDRNGGTMPAYARYIALPTANGLQNTYRPDSQVNFGHTTMRVSYGFISHIAANAFEEFWPDLKRVLFRRK